MGEANTSICTVCTVGTAFLTLVPIKNTPLSSNLKADDACNGKKYKISFPNSATESFFVTDGSKEPKWKSTHHYLDAFFVFRFFSVFSSTKIWRIFCHRNKICGSTELRIASRSHFRTHHTDSRHKFRFVRGATIVLGSSKQMWCLPSASIRLFECPNRGFQFFFLKKRGLRCFFPKPYFTFLDVISP